MARPVGAGDRRRGGMKVARTISLTETVIEEVPDPECGPGEVVCRSSPAPPAAPTCRTSTSAASCPRCSATSPRARSWRSAPASPASAAATASRSTTTRPAASAGAAAAATRRCASASARRASTPAASPSTSASRPSWWASCCRSTAWTRCSPPSPSRWPARCAPSAASASSRATPCSWSAPGASGLLNIAAAHARGVEAVWVREPQPERLARAERWGATAHGNEPVDVAIVCTPRDDAIAAAADALAPGGALCVYAPPPPDSPLAIDGNAVFMRELDVTASWSAGPADMQAALFLLRARGRPPARARHPPLRPRGDRRGARGAAQRRGAEGGRASLRTRARPSARRSRPRRARKPAASAGEAKVASATAAAPKSTAWRPIHAAAGSSTVALGEMNVPHTTAIRSGAPTPSSALRRRAVAGRDAPVGDDAEHAELEQEADQQIEGLDDDHGWRLLVANGVSLG